MDAVDHTAAPHPESGRRVHIFLALGLAALAFLLDMQVRLGVAGGVLQVVAVFVALYSGERRAVLGVCSLSSLLVVLGALVSAPGATTWVVAVNRGLAIAVVWYIGIAGLRYGAAVREISERRASEAEALAKAQTLSGLLPICSACKRVRDDEGYWEQVEQFVEAHSEAEFSHGFCPECLHQLYGDVLQDSKAAD